MPLSKACLSPWQIDLAQLFASGGPQTTTEENLSRLESFVAAHCLFDTLHVPRDYRGSAFIRSLDEKGGIFTCDARISRPYARGDDGIESFTLNPALIFKNERHLKSKVSGWLKQHMVFDASRQEREEVIEHLRRNGQSKPWFHQLIVAEYQTLFELAMTNDAIGVLFGSVSQVWLPDITELSQFVRYLGDVARKRDVALPAGELLGVFSFELSTGAVDLRLNMPPFFDLFLERLKTTDFSGALEGSRHACRTLREAFRQVDAQIRGCQGSELVSVDRVGPAAEKWNEQIARDFAVTCPSMLLRSDVVGIEIHAGVTAEEIYQTLSERIRGRGKLIRWVPPQQTAQYSRAPEPLQLLNVQNVIPFEKKLFRTGPAYRNKSSIVHNGIGCVVSFPVSIGVQLNREELSDPRVLAYAEAHRPHLYMICTRPKITLSSRVGMLEDRVELEFHFRHPVHNRPQWVPLPRSEFRGFPHVYEGGTRIAFLDAGGQAMHCRSSILYQQAVMQRVAAGKEVPLYGNESGSISEEQLAVLAPCDLEVIYIGQSQGHDLGRTAVTRLSGHEKWEVFQRHVVEENPDHEIWILLLSLGAPCHLNMTRLEVQGGANDMKELIRRATRPARIGGPDMINFVEGALISYFAPRYNDKFKKRTFPSRMHQSYERMFSAAVDVGAIELETWTSLGCRLYSRSVEPRFVHLKRWPLNENFDRWWVQPQ